MVWLPAHCKSVWDLRRYDLTSQSHKKCTEETYSTGHVRLLWVLVSGGVYSSYKNWYLDELHGRFICSRHDHTRCCYLLSGANQLAVSWVHLCLHSTRNNQWDPFSGGSIEFWKGGFQYASINPRAYLLGSLKGKATPLPKENFWISDLLRSFLVYSWGANLVVKFGACSSATGHRGCNAAGYRCKALENKRSHIYSISQSLAAEKEITCVISTACEAEVCSFTVSVV